MKRFVLSFAAVMNLLLVDQFVKAVTVTYFTTTSSRPFVEVIPGLFNLAYVENRGCAWGMLQGHVWPLAAFGLVAIGVIIWQRSKIFPKGAWGILAELLLYAGILGNLVDRLFLGHVVDMFDFHWGVHHFPCFNLADSFITVAAAILIFMSLFASHKETAKSGS